MNLRGVPHDIDIQRLMQRNQQRLQQAKEQLGRKWLLHPTNQVTRKEKK